MRALSIQTWNCFGLPQGVLSILRGDGPPDEHRLTHPELLNALARPDILCVQELWMDQAIEPFEALPHRHKLRDRSKGKVWPPTLIGAGLGIASKFPLASSGLREFSRPHSGPDRLARKGLLHARIAVPDLGEIDLINAHWQAEREAGSQRVRARQMHDLVKLIGELGSESRPFFLCGDFNINGLKDRRHGLEGEHDALMKLLPGFEDLGAEADLATFLPSRNTLARRFAAREPEQRLDYIFFRPAKSGPRLVCLETALALHEPLAGTAQREATFSSDHFALVARFRIEAPS